jgi:hypothetical protein
MYTRYDVISTGMTGQAHQVQDIISTPGTTLKENWYNTATLQANQVWHHKYNRYNMTSKYQGRPWQGCQEQHSKQPGASWHESQARQDRDIRSSRLGHQDNTTRTPAITWRADVRFDMTKDIREDITRPSVQNAKDIRYRYNTIWTSGTAGSIFSRTRQEHQIQNGKYLR